MPKKRWCHRLTIITVLCIGQSAAMILRNNALMNKMVSHFQKDNSYLTLESNKKDQDENYEEPTQQENSQKPEKVMSLMQNVLCRNFPAIPCKMIMEDATLRKLIEKSIQQIKYKTLSIEKTTAAPGYHLTLFPTINSEDLSNFLAVRQTGYYEKRHQKDEHKNKKQKNTANYWSQEKTQKSSKKNKKESKRTTVYNNRKKIRKFYPHKIKYKDKTPKTGARKDFGDYSEEKLSMSVEVPDVAFNKRHRHLSYKVEPANPPVWRIDYMKHGEPSLNKLGYDDDRLKGKLVKTGPSVIIDENVLEQGARKEVLHPDVYIKKNFMRQNPVELNSEAE